MRIFRLHRHPSLHEFISCNLSKRKRENGCKGDNICIKSKLLLWFSGSALCPTIHKTLSWGGGISLMKMNEEDAKQYIPPINLWATNIFKPLSTNHHEITAFKMLDVFLAYYFMKYYTSIMLNYINYCCCCAIYQFLSHQRTSDDRLHASTMGINPSPPPLISVDFKRQTLAAKDTVQSSFH